MSEFAFGFACIFPSKLFYLCCCLAAPGLTGSKRRDANGLSSVPQASSSSRPGVCRVMLNPPCLPRRAILFLGLSPAGVVVRSRLFGGDTRAGMHCAVLCCFVRNPEGVRGAQREGGKGERRLRHHQGERCLMVEQR